MDKYPNKMHHLLNKQVTLLFVLLLVTLGLSGCMSSKQPPSKPQSAVVGTVDGEDVTYGELKANFQSNVKTDSAYKKEIVDFLPNYLDYKAKLKEAQNAHYDKHGDIIREYENYAQKAAQSYWINRRIKKEKLDEMTERYKEQVKVSHILVSVPKNASRSDTLKAWKKLMDARKQYYEEGADFDSLAKAISSKRRGRSMGGQLKYFSAGGTLESFEKTAFSLKEDSVSKPVRTQYGYHIIKMLDRKERQRARRISHIMLMPAKNEKQDAQNMKRAQEAYSLLEQGASWDSVTAEYSEHAKTRNRGGELGWMNYGSFPETMVDSAMAMDSVGQYTRPFRTDYGIHILKMDGVQEEKSEEEIRSEMEKRLQKLPRFENPEQLVFQRIRKEGNAELNKSVSIMMQKFIKGQEATRISGDIELPEDLANAVIFSIEDTSYTCKDYMGWLKETHGDKQAYMYSEQWVEKFTDTMVNNHMIDITKEEFPEFAGEISRYMDGLIVFQITEDSVWTYAEQDTSRLRDMYNNNREDYQFGTRYHYHRIAAQEDSALTAALDSIKSGTPIDTLQSRNNRVLIRNDSLQASQTEQEPYNRLANMEPGTYSERFDFKKKRNILYLKEILQPRPMTFDEAYNKLVSRYQPMREKEWLGRLRDKYNVQRYPDRLEELVNSMDDIQI